MRIYLVSLQQDYERRALLKDRFPQYYKSFIHIQATYGKEILASDYFNYCSKYFEKHKRLLTPGEVGCTLSHIDALKAFLDTSDDYALIFEDDVIGSDTDITKTLKILSEEKKFNGLFLLGGQEGLHYEKYILGKKINQTNISQQIYEIPKFSSKFLFRTCCYIVSRKFAEHILDFHKENFNVADAWFEILNNTEFSFYYCNIFKHPLDLAGSHIEKERSKPSEPNFFKRVIKQGVFWKIKNRLTNDFHRIQLIFLGCEKVFKDRVK